MIDTSSRHGWAKAALDEAVDELMDRRLLSGTFVEARPAWAYPEQVVLGQIREAERAERFKWVTAGNVPTDIIDSSVAATPREALRHFSLKWQLDAEKFKDPEVARALGAGGPSPLAETLAAHAEALYALVELDALWEQS